MNIRVSDLQLKSKKFLSSHHKRALHLFTSFFNTNQVAIGQLTNRLTNHEIKDKLNGKKVRRIHDGLTIDTLKRNARDVEPLWTCGTDETKPYTAWMLDIDCHK